MIFFSAPSPLDPHFRSYLTFQVRWHFGAGNTAKHAAVFYNLDLAKEVAGLDFQFDLPLACCADHLSQRRAVDGELSLYLVPGHRVCATLQERVPDGLAGQFRRVDCHSAIAPASGVS